MSKGKMTVLFGLLLMVICSAGLAAFELPAPDFGGEAISVLSWYEPFESLEMAERKEMAEDLFNCTIEAITIGWGDLDEVALVRLLSGDSAHDLWILYDVHFWPLVGQRALYPLSNILPEEYYQSIGAQIPVIEHLGVRYDMNRFDPGWGLHVIFWNKEMFEREGWPDLYQLYQEGNWTWEALEQIARMATKDTTGDGSIDRWGIVGLYTRAPHWAFTNATSKFVTSETGRVMFNYQDPKLIEVYSTLAGWVVEEQIGRPWNDNLFPQGLAAMLPERYMRAAHFQESMQEEFGIVPFPMGPNTDSHVYPGHGATAYLLPANSADPKGMVALYQFLFEHEDEFERLMQLEDEIAGMVHDFESFEILLNAHESWQGEMGQYYRAMTLGIFEGAGLPKQQIFFGEKSAAVALQEVGPAVQAFVDELLQQ